MHPVSITTDEENIVITIDKASFTPEALNVLLRSITTQIMDTSHIPFVDDAEQREIERLLRNPECHIYVYDDEPVLP
jgi:hypothetical protein